MEAAFETLKQKSVNGVENLMKWIKDSKIIDQSKEADEKARKLFDGAKDKKNVQLGEFKDVITKLAADQNKSFDQFSKMLTDAVPGVQETATAAACALKNAFTNK